MNNSSTVGKSVPRLERVTKVTGSLKYLGDVDLPGMVHGKILRSTMAHATIERIDAAAAAKLPGVVAILTRDDVIGNPHYNSHYGPILKDQPVVALDRVRYVGDPVAVVAAITPAIAEEAVELIEVDYQPLPVLLTPEEAMAEGVPLLHEGVQKPKHGFADVQDVGPVAGTNICNRFQLRKGDIEKGFAESDYIFEDVFTSPTTQHAALEPLTAAAQLDSTGRLTIWSTVQNPFVIRDEMAELFNLPLSMVRVIALHLGGGYGSKLYLKLEPIVAALALKARRPVMITLTREEVFLTITKHAARIHIKTGVKKDGTIVARDCRVHLNTGAYAEIGPRVAKKSGYTAAGPYVIPNVNIESCLLYTNTVPAGAFRGFGVSQSTWAHESQTDMIARALNLDPLELRLKNLLDEGKEFVTGERIHSFALKECLQKVAAAIEWGKKVEPREPFRAAGKGLACLIKSTLTPSMSSASVRLNEDGSAHVYVGTVDIGQGSDTAMAQIASEELGIPIEQVLIVHSDTDLTPYDQSTSSSRSTFHTGRAVQLAAQEVKRELACMAAPIFRVSPEDLIFENQAVRLKSGPGSEALAFRDLLVRHFGINGANLMGHGIVRTRSVDEKGGPHTSSFWFAGATAAEVEVDTETGRVRILRYATAADVGKVINPLHCEQQLRGAAITGIGQALLEELVYQGGVPINPNFLDYNLPRFLDIPERLIVILVERPHPDGPYGAKGVGETAVIPAAPAIANAIEDAVGVRIKDLPITPEKVLRALQEAAGKKTLQYKTG
ncbi:MAG: xanthine dehydrogenase family protein molybdopterin-binding subunit [Acidobacteria bacterium]|nr:xanthine dehydrogenase family protein molybdopterin-binding subunit [Acidobacteriota bacterium]